MLRCMACRPDKVIREHMVRESIVKRSRHYLNSSLFQGLVLIEYLLPVPCVRNLEHGDSFDWFGHFDFAFNGEPEMQLVLGV